MRCVKRAAQEVSAGLTPTGVSSQFSAPSADCSVAINLSMKISDSGGMIAGPYSHAGMIAGDGSTLEIAFMMLGTGPGSHVELDHAKRISMNMFR